MKQMAIAAVGLLAVLLVGLMLVRSNAGDSNTAVVDSGPGVVAPADPPRPSVPSPEDAAKAAVAMTGDVVTAGLISRRELIGSFTTADFGPELADLTSEQVTAMQLSMTETGRSTRGLSVVEFPLRTRTLRSGPERATVEVWSVLVVASADEPVARQAWRTVTVELVLVDDRWLVDGWASVEGPAPAGAPTGVVASGREVADRLGWSGVG